jgi:hypothetical protein
MITLRTTIDTITPKLKRVQKKLSPTTAKQVEKILKYGKARAKFYAQSDKTQNLADGIGYRVYKKTGKGTLFSMAVSPSGFPYNLFVNLMIPISTERKSKYYHK